MTLNNATEVWDAYGYFSRAVGFQNMLTDLLQAHRPSSEDMARAYSGTWPPLQPVLLSLGFLVFGNSLLVGRLIMIVLSALTAPLVYLVTEKLSSKHVALIASVIFAIFPSFIHYSIRLFSETTFIFITFLVLYCALRTVEGTPSFKRTALLAMATGCLLGLGTLTRAAGLLWIPIVALWVGWRSIGFKKRLLLPALILISAGITLLPWEIALFAVEHRPVVITTSSELTLYLGNNPWLPDGYGAAAEIAKPQMDKAASEYGKRHGVSISEAYRALALQEIKGDPIKFVKRGFYKLRTLWLPDFQLFRYILVTACPPMTDGRVGLIILVAITSLLAFLALALWGLWNPNPTLRFRELLIVLVLATMATIFVTHGHPRYSIPLLAVLTPAAGHGLACLSTSKQKRVQPYVAATVLCVAVVGLSILTGFPYEYRSMSTVPSSHYLGLIRRIDQLLGQKTMVSDRLLFRASSDNHPGEVRLLIDGSEFEFTDSKAQTYTWSPAAEAGVLSLVVQSQTATRPFRLLLSSGDAGQSATLWLNKRSWHSWQPTSLTGVEYMWAGSAKFPLLSLGNAVAGSDDGESR
jgi:4-amino-4-deoxy-L-arabinose transferase-like glycosyltransferase